MRAVFSSQYACKRSSDEATNALRRCGSSFTECSSQRRFVPIATGIWACDGKSLSTNKQGRSKDALAVLVRSVGATTR